MLRFPALCFSARKGKCVMFFLGFVKHALPVISFSVFQLSSSVLV